MTPTSAPHGRGATPAAGDAGGRARRHREADMFIPPVLFAYGARLLGDWLTKGSGGGLFGGPPPLDYTFYAVPHCAIEEFIDAHPDAVEYDVFARRVTQAGYGSYSGSVLDQGRAMARRNPGCVVVCADFRRA